MNKRTPEQWQSLFDEQAQSGQSAAAFCKVKKLCPKYFSLRRKQLAAGTPSQQPSTPFVQAIKATSNLGPTTVRLRHQSTECIFEQASPSFIAAVLKALS